MENNLKHDINNFLKENHIRLSKRLGQNFLISEKAIVRLVETADITEGDTILEIGPGIGNLTKEMAKLAKQVIAIEKDGRMCELLKETLKDFKNVKVIRGDALRVDNLISEFLEGGYKIAANLPFYITAPVIRKFLESDTPPQRMVLIVQKEVGERICSTYPDLNILAVSVQFYAKPEIISNISKTCFLPAPKVDSVILKITPSYTELSKDIKFREQFFKIVKAGFSQPRKQIINNFSNNLKISREETKTWLAKNDIKPEQRAQTLRVEDWIKLSQTFKVLGD